MKKTYCNLAAAFAIAFAAAPAAFAADDGDIYEFTPVTDVVTSANPLTPPATVQFKMRLLSPNYNAADKSARTQWQVYYKPDPFMTGAGSAGNAALAWALRPLQLGIVVSGQTRGATVNLPSAIYDNRLSEFDCSYTVKFGDLALPLKLATDGNGTAVGDGQDAFQPSTDGRYYFLNDDLWGIGYLPNGATETAENIVWLKPYRRQTLLPNMMPPDGERNGSFDLAFGFDPSDAGGAYFIKTIGFDPNPDHAYTDGTGTYWRMVNEKRTTCKGDVPSIVVDEAPEDPKDLYVYVWSENDSIVTLQFSDNATELASAGVTKETFKDRNGTMRDFWVKKIGIVGVSTEYPFSIRGVAGASGQTTRLVMSAKLGYRTDGAGDLLEDFLVAEVKCGEPLKPTVTVKVNGGSSATVDAVPQSGVATRVATLTVEVSDPYTGDLTVDIAPKLAVDGVAGGDAFSYFGISEKAESLSYLDKVSSVTFTASEFAVAATSYTKTLYVYSWGADANTYAVNKSVGFYPTVSDAAATFYSGGMEEAYLLVKPIKPVIVEPVADQLISVNASVAYPLSVKVSDTYNDMKSDTGYELFIKRDISDLNFESLGFFKPDAEGVLYSIPTAEDPEAHLPLVTWENTATETAVLYVKSPESKEKSEERQIKLYVRPARQVGIITTDGKEGNQYVEGEDVNVSIVLENGSNDTGAEIYAFLVPQSEDAANAVSATWLAKNGGSGRPIQKSGTNVNGLFTLVDGTSETKQGATYDFKVELRTRQSYSDPDGKKVAGFESKTLTVYSQNVVPKAEFVEMNDGADAIYNNGETFDTILAKNVPAKFKVYVDEPGTYDKTTDEAGKKFKSRWRVSETGKNAVVAELEGNPDTLEFEYTFSKAGTAKVEIDFQDKDMNGRYGNGELNQKFTFYVNVVDNPQITITTYTSLSSFEESECTDFGGEASIDVNVSMNPIDVPLLVQLTIVPPSYNEGDNPGLFVLQEDANCAYVGKDTSDNDIYIVTLDGVLSQTVYVKAMDGTPLSKQMGFTIKSQVLNDDIPYPNVPGETPASYYKGVDRRLVVVNSDPTAEISDFSPAPGTTNRVAIGTSDTPITWNFTDVPADFTKGITVTIKGGGGHTETVTTQAGASGSWSPTFSSSGLHIITMTIADKDGGRVRDPELIWYYQVEVSKTLTAVPHGPATGFRGAHSIRYSEADGLGSGHVYCGVPASVSRFTSIYNCGLAKTWTIWGFGYKTSNMIDNGTLEDGKLDFAISPSGNLLEKDLGDDSYFKYAPPKDASGNSLDSFLYAWLVYSVGEGESSTLSDSLLGGTIAPEHAETDATTDTGALIALPTELLDDGTYADMIVEALFSHEYRMGDNMGDMNQDGIPDRFLVKYGLGIYDTVSSTVTGDDLANVAGFNDDEDFLPATASATIATPGASNAWTVATMPFTAIYEIRGYHNGLNIPGVTEMDMSDAERRAFKRYLVSIAEEGDADVEAAIAAFTSSADTKSDEYLAETAALETVFKKGIWTPENPTDPTKEDSDGDTMPDGYEYYFWYCAHVLGATGERYGFWAGDISKPTVISSKEIETLFNPNDKRDWTSGGQFASDTDGDGIPDMVEYALGTNPIHWDSDGDGMPDGLEVMYGSDPLKANAADNPDKDYMAYSLARDQLVVEIDNGGKIEIWTLDNVHSKSANGETYYKYHMIPWEDATTYEPYAYILMLKTDKGDVPQYAFLTETDDEDEAKAELAKYADNDQVLADMPVRKVYVTSEKQEVGDPINRYWIGAETTLKAGLQLTSVQADGSIKAQYVWANLGDLEDTAPRFASLVDGVHGDDKIPNELDPAAVPGLVRAYRLGDAEAGPYSIKMTCSLDMTPEAKSQVKGSLTYFDGDKEATADLSGEGLTIVRLETAAQVARYHAQVFAENGFDPRTGWGSCQDGYCADRWCKTCSTNKKFAEEAGTAGLAVNTSAFTALNEYRLMHYRYMNGLANSATDLADVVAKTKTLQAVWSDRTTNPQVTYDDSGAVTKHGADTDSDGAPDGWELYVLKSPNPTPNGTDATDDEWDIVHKDGAWSSKREGDGLELPGEFAGTDTLLAYIDCPTIGGFYKGTEEGKLSGWIWLNKFFPTNPYSSDTDGDGLSDAEEMAVGMDRNDYTKSQYGNSDPRVKPTSFIYGSNKDLNVDDNSWGYADDDGSTCVRGGGLNPCTIDTDGDRLPDGWEYQFAGIYRASATTEKESGGYLDFGMDGTDPYDACTYKRGSLYPEDIDPRTGTLRNFDFDIDGLQNYQEYLTQALRHLRYDVIRVGTTMEGGDSAPLIEGIMIGTPFYQETLAGPIDYVFGPTLTEDAKPADDATRRGFFGAPPHGWDFAALRDGGARFARFMLTPGTAWGLRAFTDVWKPKGYVAAHSYATTDPRMRDSDLDGMDDFYELFHGLNPLLGERAAIGGAGADLIASAYADTALGRFGALKSLPLNCFNNWFSIPDAVGDPLLSLPMDFVRFPWLAGMPLADPDGDGLRNDNEMIQVNTATPQPANTDPTPMWMTDPTFDYSYTAQYYRQGMLLSAMWPLGSNSNSGAKDIEGDDFMFSFEMNEGYDTDNDGIPDGQEITQTLRSASDPQLFTDPVVRQALYFPGPSRKSSSLAISFEPAHPANTTTRRTTSAADIFRQFTVECWIRPEAKSLAEGSKCTVLERICAYPQSNYASSNTDNLESDPPKYNGAEKHYVRATFRIGIENGSLYGLIDNSDAKVSESYPGVSSAKVMSDVALSPEKWYHVAITYDGSEFAIIVKDRDEADRKGRRQAVTTRIIPANGVTEVLQQVGGAFPYYSYEAYDTAFLLGASADEVGMNLQGDDPEPTADNYSRHYVGYIGEVRVWDGVRTVEEIAATHDRKLSYEEIAQIRNDVYDSWAEGGSRSATDGTEVLPAELIQQYTFEGLHGATESKYVATAPSAFAPNVKTPVAKALTAINGKKVSVNVGWLAGLDSTLRPSVYTDYAYVPWIKNTVAHMPMMDGSVADSIYWGENLAGDHAPVEVFASKFVFQNTANPYAFVFNLRDLTSRHMRYTVLNGGTQDEDAASTNTVSGSSIYSSLLDLYRFDLRCRMSSTSDLVPIGGVYAKRCVDFWDGQGAMDADLVTTDGGSAPDQKGDGIPDWWEEYCRDNYFVDMDYDSGMTITLDTIVNYGGLYIKASEAYLRDIAQGMLPDTDYNDDYKDVADFDYDGMPDWWEKMYGIDTCSVSDSKADADNDGLNNLTEYILSERFDLTDANGDSKLFSPIDARTGGTVEPDYFFRVGELYVGEIFSDHDWIEDWWEEGYRADYVSTLVYDAIGDNDGDRWSAWAEARYSQQVSPIVANNLFHYNVTDGLVPDYPMPTIQLKVRYNGSRVADVRNASIGVKIGRTLDPAKSFDAEYYIKGTSKGSGSVSGSSGGSNASSNLYAHVIGKWSDRHVYGTLTPGFINSSSIELQTAYDPSDVVYSWSVKVQGSDLYQRGTKAEYNQALRTYGSDNVKLLSTSEGYGKLDGLEIRTDLTSEIATLRFKNGVEAGTINLKTGEYDLDFGVFKNGILVSSTNSSFTSSMEDQTYRFVYSANESTGLPRDLYLGEADNGCIYEGNNAMIVWADLNDNMSYDVGEPFGFVRDVDIGWRRRAVEVELLDESPVAPRVRLVSVSSGNSSSSGSGSSSESSSTTAGRGETLADYYVTISNRCVMSIATQAGREQAIRRMRWIYTNRVEIADATDLPTDGSLTRVRVVRWLVDGNPVYKLGCPAKVVLDKMFNLAEHPTITEADLLVDGEFDLDWDSLATDISDADVDLEASSVAYLVVIGDGPDHWRSEGDSETVVKIVDQVIERTFYDSRTKPLLHSPGEAQSIVYDSRPTFSWTIPGDEVSGYTAFRIQILPETGTKVVWDSGVQMLPPRDAEGRYVWTAPVYVGNELDASVNYRWRVTGLNAKFRNPLWSDDGIFRMEPNTVGADCGRIDVCVKYFGPADVLDKGNVVVEAFESPDFTGDPVARAVVADKTAVAAVETAHAKQVSLYGRKGVYYVRAYIDSKDYGVANVRDDWESWGYVSDRSGSRSDIFSPVALTIDDAIGRGDLAVVYVEDADTNGNRLPDAWEMAFNKGKLSNGTANIDQTLDCGLAIKDSLADTISEKQVDGDDYNGMLAHYLGSLRSRGMVALAIGVSPESINVNSSGQIVVENLVESVDIESISFDGETLSIKVVGKMGETPEVAASDVYDVKVSSSATKTVVCDVYRRESLSASDDWSLVTSAQVTVGADAATIPVQGASGASGFYKVAIRQ